MKPLVGFFIVMLLLSSCSLKPDNASLQNTTVLDKQVPQEPFVPFNSLTDDPDNPSSHNPLIKKFGNIPEVRTYIRFKQKLGSGTPLTVDEAIALFTADLYLYPYRPTEQILKSLKETKKRHEQLGFPADTPVLRSIGGVTHDLTRGDSVIRNLPDGTRIISDSRVKDGYLVIPGKEKETSPKADIGDKNPSVNTQE